MLPIVINILLAVHIAVSLLIVLIVLMQRPKNEGLGAAFGGGMTDNLFGAQTTNVLQVITRWLGGIFFTLTLTLSFLYVKQSATMSSVHKSLLGAPAIVPPPAPPALPEAATDPVKADGTPVIPDAPKAAPADPAKPVETPAPAPAEASKPVESPKAPEPVKPAESPAPAPPEKPAN